MMPAPLKETTMDPRKRTPLPRTVLSHEKPATGHAVQRLVGNKPESRFGLIQERTAFAAEDQLDI